MTEGWTMDEIPGADERRRELREIDTKYRFFYEMLGGSVLVGIGILIGWVLFTDKESYAINLFTDAISISV
jgi:hypothetical protein